MPGRSNRTGLRQYIVKGKGCFLVEAAFFCEMSDVRCQMSDVLTTFPHFRFPHPTRLDPLGGSGINPIYRFTDLLIYRFTNGPANYSRIPEYPNTLILYHPNTLTPVSLSGHYARRWEGQNARRRECFKPNLLLIVYFRSQM